MKLDATLLDEEVLVGRVVASVRAVSGLPLARITLDARLHEDLGFDRAKGYALMASLHDQFAMDWTGFAFDLHFGGNGSEARPLTISRLAGALREGRWPADPAPEPRPSRLALLVGMGLLLLVPVLAGGCAE